MELTTMIDYYNSSTLNSIAVDYSSTTEKSISESFNETLQKVITTKDMVRVYLF